MQTRSDAPARGWLTPSTIALGLTTLPMLTWGACSTGLLDEERGFWMWGMAVLVSLMAGGVALVQLLSGERQRGISVAAVIFGLLSPLLSFALSFFTMNLSLTSGRALRRLGRARTPPSEATDAWTSPELSTLDAPDEVAMAWRANAATEAASVASFSHLSTDLLALGAPSELVEKAHADALDEIRHARLCYAVAQAIDGQQLGAGAFPEAVLRRDGALSKTALAVECAIESCVLEEAAARVAQLLSERDSVPEPVAQVLQTIAEDEARHAEHGWEILMWCLDSAPERSLESVLRAVSALRPERGTSPVSSDAYEVYGIAGPSLWSQCIEAAQLSALRRLELLRPEADRPARAA